MLTADEARTRELRLDAGFVRVDIFLLLEIDISDL